MNYKKFEIKIKDYREVPEFLDFMEEKKIEYSINEKDPDSIVIPMPEIIYKPELVISDLLRFVNFVSGTNYSFWNDVLFNFGLPNCIFWNKNNDGDFYILEDKLVSPHHIPTKQLHNGKFYHRIKDLNPSKVSVKVFDIYCVGSEICCDEEKEVINGLFCGMFMSNLALEEEAFKQYKREHP